MFVNAMFVEHSRTIAIAQRIPLSARMHIEAERIYPFQLLEVGLELDSQNDRCSKEGRIR